MESITRSTQSSNIDSILSSDKRSGLDIGPAKAIFAQGEVADLLLLGWRWLRSYPTTASRFGASRDFLRFSDRFYVWEGQNEVLRLIDADGNGDKPMRLTNRYLYGDAVDMLLAEEDFVSPLSGLSYAPAMDSSYSFVPGNNYWPLGHHSGSIRDRVDSNGPMRMHAYSDNNGGCRIRTTRSAFAIIVGTKMVSSPSIPSQLLPFSTPLLSRLEIQNLIVTQIAHEYWHLTLR